MAAMKMAVTAKKKSAVATNTKSYIGISRSGWRRYGLEALRLDQGVEQVAKQGREAKHPKPTHDIVPGQEKACLATLAGSSLVMESVMMETVGASGGGVSCMIWPAE
jgi:hypothetical protein